jgi:riboflavin kinase / FMN adenylyltransferase
MAFWFPTASLAEIPTLVPAPGVYACRALLAGMPHAGAVHIGPDPTSGENNAIVEVHLLDFSQDLYGEQIDLVFHCQVREVQQFPTPDALQAQLNADLQQARRCLAELPDC